jgi:polyhydroxybutyrate depolymerase
MGDVNGNWSPPEGSEALGESYLSELIKSQGGSLGQWGLVDTSVEDDASEDVTKASDLEKVTDGKEYSQDLSSVEIVVNGTVRDYYVYVPSSSNTSPIPLLYLLNGGSAERTPFEQQSNFEAMADREGIVLVVPVSQKLPSNESAWQLNADNSSMQDIDYIEAIYTDVSSRTAIDANRVYAIGYSLGGMFSYELACQMSNRFAAIGSLAGSMPVAPTYCDPYRNVPILHVHGVQDEIIPYSSQWEWKAWDAVGTMRDTPSLIEFWSSRYNCSKQSKRSITATVDLDVREDCESGARVEHYRLENGTHVWPTLIGDLETPEVFWSFLSSFSLESTSP